MGNPRSPVGGASWSPSMGAPGRESNFGRERGAIRQRSKSLNRANRASNDRSEQLRSGRPFGSAGVAVEADERRRSGNGHRRMPVVSVAQVDGDHAAPAAIRAAPIAVQRASAAEQRVAARQRLVFGNRHAGVFRLWRLGPRRDSHAGVATRERKDDRVDVRLNNAEARTPRRARQCGKTAHP
jgi:hypothetical protein